VSEDLQRQEQLFSDAIAIEDVVERRAFLQRAAGEDVDLRERVHKLLQAVDRTGKYFDRVECAAASGRPPLEAGEQVGDRIGPYKLLERIGEGGFGVVYVAEQEEPIRRRLALKIIKLGMDTKQVIARFEVERQALALMEHPNIAKVFDAGATEPGRPYFVMELVRGVPITKFCDENRLTLERRLKLFIEVCDAVQHAHQKGIIHRDLKPSNILVTMNGHRAVPKVIDFGIAKATHEPLTDKTLYTRFHQFIGTPEYISPEQAEMSEVKVDTRSDIYSLGVLLYELLVGRPPFASKELLKAGFEQVRRVLREEEPLRPSRQLGRLDRIALTTTAECRQCAPQQLLAWFRGDLEHVILKAIEKDVERRYASAAALAEDIQRFLKQEPVTAVRPSRIYLVRKFVRRHRVGVTAAVLVIAALLIGFVRTSRANVRAQREAAYATATLNFIQEDLLGRLDPFVSHAGKENWGRNLSLLEAVQTAAAGLGERFADQPLVEASLRLTIGRTYLRLGEAGSAAPHLQRAFTFFANSHGPDNLQTLEARHHYAESLRQLGRAQEAIAIHEQVLVARTQLAGPLVRTTLESVNALARALLAASPTNSARAGKLFRQTLTEGELEETDRLTLQAKMGLSEVCFQEGAYEQFRLLRYEVYETARQVLGPEHPEFLSIAAERAYDLRYRLNDLRAAEALGRETLATCRRVLGPDHPTTLMMVMEAGFHLAIKGLWEPALNSRSTLSETTRRRYGDEHPTTLWTGDVLGGHLRHQGDLAEAERILAANVAARDRDGQTQTSEYQRSRRWLSLAVFGQGRVEEAQRIYETVVQQARQAQAGRITPAVLYNTFRLIILFGNQADWPPVVQHYLELAPQDSLVGESYWYLGQLPPTAGALSAHLADNQAAVDQMLELLMNRHMGDTNLNVTSAIAMAGLALPPQSLSEAQRQEVFRMASVASKVSTDPLQKALLSGIVAYRNKDSNEAIQSLATLARNPDHALAATAGFVLAMARFDQGAVEKARRSLNHATQTLEVGIQPGLLGHRAGMFAGYNLRWADYARSLVLRDEAEMVVLGRITSPPVNRDSLLARRKAWQPRQNLLEEAHQHGRDRDWIKAAEAFECAIQQGSVNWDHEGNLIGELPLKAAVVFALTGNPIAYAHLCRELVEPAAVTQSYYGRIALLWPEAELSSDPAIPHDLRGRAIEMARWDAAQVAPAEVQLARHDRTWLYLGIAEYRDGNFSASLEALAKAREAFNLAAAGTAHAFSALASHATRQHADAAGFLDQAESLFLELLAGNPDQLSQDWEDVAVLELALREAKVAPTTSGE